jgi:TonB family protein
VGTDSIAKASVFRIILSVGTSPLWIGAIVLVLTPLSVWAQDWTPTKIVAITDYPALPRAARIQGTVEVRCTLDSSGNVTVAAVLSGPPELRDAARSNALQWKFQRTSPEVRGSSTTLTYVFLLEGAPQNRVNTTFVFELPNRLQIVAPTNYITGAP